MDKEIKIKVKSLHLIRRRDFVNAVIEESGNTDTYKQAYEKIEEEYSQIFGVRRYSDYSVFRNAKHREQNPKNTNQLKLF